MYQNQLQFKILETNITAMRKMDWEFFFKVKKFSLFWVFQSKTGEQDVKGILV